MLLLELYFLSLSKEGIIHSFNTIVSSAFVFILAIVGGFFTSIYTLKIYIYCFYRLTGSINGSLTLFYSSFYSKLNNVYSTFYSSFIYWSSLIPYPLYCGSILTIISVDNGNIGFILLSIILFPFIDWIAGFESKTMNISFLLFYLFFGLILCFLLISLLLFFICYECLILLLFFILFLFIPTYYRIRTAFFFFLFSIYWVFFGWSFWIYWPCL